MKKITLLFLILINLSTLPLKAQDLIISKSNEVLTYNIGNKNITGSSEKKQAEKYKQVTYLDNIAFHIDQIALELKESDNYDFAQGIQSPFNSNLWIYMEREEIGAGYYIREYDKKLNKTRNILINKNKLRKDIAFKPIAWTNNLDELYVEGLYLNSAEEHEGIWILNIKSRKLTKIDLGFSYMSTPLLSENREKFYFLGTLDSEIDYLHGRTDIVYEFNLRTNKRTIVTQSKGDSMIIHGWKNQIINNSTTNQARVSNLDYYLPWDFGVQYCVSRHGTPAPSGAHTHMGRCNVFASGGQHTYAGIDFDTSNSIDENVRAAADGRVTFTGISGSLTSGYGRLVIITHSDGTRTYYAHNKTILVNEGQNVTRSQIIAKEGTTGGSTGDHIHFEWRAAGGTSPTIGSFKDIGQPRQDYRYKSNNTSTPISTIPVLNSPGAGTSVASPVSLTWSTNVSGASCRIQISRVNTGWTAANGFTTETAATANVPVNYSTPGLLNYTWPNEYTADANKPVAGGTYYWTVRSYSAATGTSSYSPVRSFRVTTASATSNRTLADNTNLVVYPNPGSEDININFNAAAQETTLSLFDISGKQIFEKNYTTQKGANSIKENVAGLQKGMYILMLNNGEKVSTQNIIIQ